MKRLQPFVFSAALLFLAACGQDTQPAAATPSFNFSVDPAAGSVNLTSADTQTLKALQIDECGSAEPRTLFAGGELTLTSYDAAFLPGNLLQITAEFTNVTDFTFEQPFTFMQTDSTSNIVSSQEPEVTDADLGGDGALSPDETTSTLTFTVEHKGQPFTYEVLAEAVVNCGDEGPGDTDGADLEVTKTGDAEVVIDPKGFAALNYSVVVTNNGGVAAEGVTLTDTIAINLADLVGVTADIAAVLPLPDGCIVDATVLDGSVIICTIGTLDAGASTEFTLGFEIDLGGDLSQINAPITVTNAAEVATDTPESDDTNNAVEVETDLVTPVLVLPVADLEVTKTGDTEVVTDPKGDTTLNYTVVVTNNGDAVAEGTELTDTFTIDLSALDGAGEVTATVLPDECVLDADASVGGAQVATCTLGALASGGSTTLDFSFAVNLPVEVLEPGSSFPVTNTAVASTTTDEDDLSNNSILVNSSVNVPAAVPAVADLEVTKTGDTTVVTIPGVNTTLNYSVVVRNNGDAIADGTTLTDTFTIDLSASNGVGDVTATVLPNECIIDAVASVGGTEVATCTLGALKAGGSTTLDFSFTVNLLGVPPGTSFFPVTNTANASTTTNEVDTNNNSGVVESLVIVDFFS